MVIKPNLYFCKNINILLSRNFKIYSMRSKSEDMIETHLLNALLRDVLAILLAGCQCVDLSSSHGPFDPKHDKVIAIET